MTATTSLLFDSPQRRNKRLLFSTFRKRRGSESHPPKRVRKWISLATFRSRSHRWFRLSRKSTDSKYDNDDDDDDQSPRSLGSSKVTGVMTEEEEELSQNYQHDLKEDSHSEYATCSNTTPPQYSRKVKESRTMKDSKEYSHNNNNSNNNDKNSSEDSDRNAHFSLTDTSWWDASLLDLEQYWEDDDNENEEEEEIVSIRRSTITNGRDGSDNNQGNSNDLRYHNNRKGKKRKSKARYSGGQRLPFRFFQKLMRARQGRGKRNRLQDDEEEAQPQLQTPYSDSDEDSAANCNFLLHDRQLLSAFTIVPTPTTIDASNPMEVEIQLPPKRTYQWELGLYASASQSQGNDMRSTTNIDDHNSTSLAVSFSEDCAQLVVHQSKSSDGEDEVDEEACEQDNNRDKKDRKVSSIEAEEISVGLLHNQYSLGVAFPHPMAAVTSNKDLDDSSASESSQISFKEIQLKRNSSYVRSHKNTTCSASVNNEENIWTQIESDEFFGDDFAVDSSPPPIVNLETTRDNSTSSSFWGETTRSNKNNNKKSYGWDSLGWSFSQDEISMISFSDSINNNVYKPICRLAKDVPKKLCGTNIMEEEEVPYDEVDQNNIEIVDISTKKVVAKELDEDI